MWVDNYKVGQVMSKCRQYGRTETGWTSKSYPGGSFAEINSTLSVKQQARTASRMLRHATRLESTNFLLFMYLQNPCSITSPVYLLHRPSS